MPVQKNPYGKKGGQQSTAQTLANPNSDNMDSIDLSDKPLLKSLWKTLRPFQREAVEFCVLGKRYSRQLHGIVPNGPLPNEFPRGRVLIGDEMGLGKTVSSLGIMSYYQANWPLLIVCPPSLRYTWPSEIEKFLPELPVNAVYIVQGFQDTGFIVDNKVRKGVQIVVCTYSLFQNRSAVAHLLKSHGYLFQCVIADESHNLKNHESQRTKLLLPILKQSRYLVLLSGTPALSRPIELWSQLYVLNDKAFGSYQTFGKQYCGARKQYIGRGRYAMDYSGSSNLSDLHSKLQHAMVRRLKSCVLDELPPKQRSIVNLAMNPDEISNCKQCMKTLSQSRRTSFGDGSGSRFESNAALMQAYQQTGIGKAASIADYLMNVWLPGSNPSEKILVFGHHTAVLDTIEEALLKGTKKQPIHIRIDGGVATNLRAQLVRKFQNSSHVRVALLSMTAAGVGLTLTAASTVMFAELHWTPGVLAQAEDRAHRIGQTAKQVQILYMVSRNTEQSVDSQLWRMLGRKIHTVDQAIDGKSDKPYLYAASETAPVSHAGKGVQEELTAFFASEAEPHVPKKKKAPVKGTIESFFKKALKGNDSKPLSNRKDVAKPIVTTPSVDHGSVKWGVVDLTSPLSQRPVVSGNPATETIHTFDNSKTKSKRGWHTCDMCNEPYVIEPLEEIGCTRSPLQPVVLDLPSRSTTKSSASKKPHRVAQSQDSPDVVLDGSDVAGVSGSQRPSGKQSRALAFSVSKNTGRLTVHFTDCNGKPKKSTIVNFEIHDVVTDKTVDDLLVARTSRGSRQPMLSIAFDDSRVQSVVKRLTDNSSGKDLSVEDFASDLKLFVKSYLGLREVEKKAIQESGRAFLPASLERQAVELMFDSEQRGSTVRYSGGARERAMENRALGCATQQDALVLGGRGCAWCGKPLSSAARLSKSTYCSEECAVDGRLRRRSSADIRKAVFALEGGTCTKCGIDAHALFEQIRVLQPVQRSNKLLSVGWKMPRTKKALDSLLLKPQEGQFWQVDHIVAVSEGGGGCGLENLRTLCVPCHSAETEKLRGRLKLQAAAATVSKRTQPDIRDAFAAATKRTKKN